MRERLSEDRELGDIDGENDESAGDVSLPAFLPSSSQGDILQVAVMPIERERQRAEKET